VAHAWRDASSPTGSILVLTLPSFPPFSLPTQANALLTVKPTVTKLLNDRITELEAELLALRDRSKVEDLERKIQVLYRSHAKEALISFHASFQLLIRSQE
jgi:hypothetical protein